MKRPENWRDLGSIVRPLAMMAVTVQLSLAGFMSQARHEPQLAALENSPDIESLVSEVFNLNEQKDHQKAIEVLLSTVEQEPEDSMMRALLVQTFDLFLEQEVEQGQKDIEKNKGDVKAYSRVAGALELLGENFRAKEVLLSGLGVKPNAADLWMKIARLEHKAHHDMEALDVFKEVIRLDKKNSDAYNNAAYILARAPKSNDADLLEAEQYAKRAHQIDPNNPEYLDTLAELQFRRGNQLMAKNLIEQAIKLAPTEDALKNQLKRFKGEQSFVAE